MTCLLCLSESTHTHNKSMLSGAILSFGRVHCHGLQLFYQLLALEEDRYLLKYYNQSGRPQLVRPLSLPAKPQQVEAEQNCMLVLMHQPFCVALVDLEQSQLHAVVHVMEEGIGGIACMKVHRDSGSVVWTDHQRRVYLVSINTQTDYRLLHTAGRPVVRMDIDTDDTLVLIHDKEPVSRLKVEWSQGELESAREGKGEIDLFNSGQFVVNHTTRRAWREVEGEEEEVADHSLSISELVSGRLLPDKFHIYVGRDSRLLFHSSHHALVMFNLTDLCIYTVYEDVFRVSKAFPEGLKADNFMTTFRKDSEGNVQLRLTVYDEVRGGGFKQSNYEISGIQGAEAVNFIRHHFSPLFLPNGLIDPLFEGKVAQLLDEFHRCNKESISSFESHSSGQRGGPLMSGLELACRLFRVGLQFFPSSIKKLLARLRGHMSFVKDAPAASETRRFFDYCRAIQEDLIEELLSIAESIQRVQDVVSSVSSQHRDQLKNVKTISENMVGFVEVLTRQLWREENWDEVLSAGTKNKDRNRRLEEYEEVGQASKTLFLTADLLQHIELHSKIRSMLRRIQTQKKEATSHWQQALSSKGGQPVLHYDYFEALQHLTLAQPGVYDVVYQMLCIRTDFFQACVLYQNLLDQPAPHLDSASSRLIFHLQHIPFYRLKTHRALQSQSEQHGQDDDGRLPQLVAAALCLKSLPVIKYLLNLCVNYQRPQLVTTLAFSPVATSLVEVQDHISIIQALVAVQKVDLAHIYVLKHHSPQLMEELYGCAAKQGGGVELMELRAQNLLPPMSEGALREHMRLSDNDWKILESSFIDVQERAHSDRQPYE